MNVTARQAGRNIDGINFFRNDYEFIETDTIRPIENTGEFSTSKLSSADNLRYAKFKEEKKKNESFENVRNCRDENANKIFSLLSENREREKSWIIREITRIMLTVDEEVTSRR